MVKLQIPSKYIKENKAARLPRNVLYFDTETKTRKEGPDTHHRMLIAWTCFKRYDVDGKVLFERWTEHFDTYQLCKYFTRCIPARAPLYIFGHNVFFDLQVSDFFFYFPRWKWLLDFIYDKGLDFILCIHKDKSKIKALSSTNYFPCSLKKLGELIGIEKGAPDFDNATIQELSPYCRNDVLILVKSMEYYFQFCRDNDMGNFGMTRASQSFNTFRHRFMNTKIAIHQDENIIDLERSAYHGGRVECYRFGYMPPRAYCTLDINSMYPYIMKNFEMPVCCIDYVENPPVEKLPYLLKKYALIADVNLDTDKPAYAVNRNEKVMFPVGRFRAFLCTKGLDYAFKNNHILSINRLALYRKAVIFCGFIDYFYQLRKYYRGEGNELMALVCKYIMNSLYGKFGQRIPVQEMERSFIGKDYYRIETCSLVTGETMVEYKLFNTVVRHLGFKEGKNTFVSIPAHITEYARFLLWDIIEKAGFRKVVYCDTDGIKIAVQDVGALMPLIHDTKLGALKVEDTFSPLIILGNKYYYAGNVRRIKGVPLTATMEDTVKWRYNTFLRSPTHQTEGINRWLTVRETVKNTPPLYDKGIVNPGGFISPFVLREF